MVNEEAEALKAEGNKLVGQKKWSVAAKKYKKAAALDPSNVVYWSNLAFCYEKMDWLDEFKEAARMCLAVDPSFVKGYYRLAKAHECVWEYEDQKAVLEKGLALDPQNPDMQTMLKSAKNQIFLRDGYEELILKVPDDNPILFGGLPPECKLQISTCVESFAGTYNSAFFGLKRHPLPPISKKYAELSQFNKKIRPAIESFFNGELKVLWYCIDHGITVEGYVPNDSVPVIAYTFSLVRTGDYDKICSKTETEQHTKYHGVLTIDQKMSLKIVLMQRFLRENGIRMGGIISECTLSGMINALAKDCQGLKLFNDSADLRLAFADISFVRRFKGTSIVVFHLAEDLETAKRYVEAAEIYTELCRRDIFEEDLRIPKDVLHCCAGLAFKRAQDYISAEREYVTALRENGSSWNWSETPGNHAANILKNMMIFYEIVHRAVVSGLKRDYPHKRMQKACHLLVGLLSCAGYSYRGNTMFLQASMYEICLKPKYKTKSEAYQAVVHATMAPTIEEYHERLFSCHRDDCSSVFVPEPSPQTPAEMQADLLKDQAKKSKSCARELYGRGENGSSWTCNGCKKITKDNKECPCHTVVYCSKECQVKHWPIHKRSCPNRKKGYT